MIFLIPVSVLAFALNAAMTRAVQLKFPNRRGILRIYQALFCMVAAGAFGIAYITNAPPTFLTGGELLLGTLFGIFFFLAVVTSSIGYEIGSMSLTSIILNMSLFIPLLYSYLFLKERMTALHLIGIALIAVTMVLSVDKSGRGEKNSLLWFAVVLIGFFANGITAVLQKIDALTYGEDGTMGFMTVAYATAALLFLANALLCKKRTGESLMEKPLLLVGMSAASGLGSFGGNALLGILCTNITGAVLYPCINGGLCILCAVISFTIFKEAPSRRKLCAIALGSTAIVLLCI